MSTFPIKIELIGGPDVNKEHLAQFAAGGCYSPELPKFGESKINVRTRLVETGHHTTLEHSHVTFVIEGIAISDVTFGLHLVSVFYNSDQRSGRFCGKMFENPNISEIIGYINYFYDISEDVRQKISFYIKQSADLYFKNIVLATEIAEKFLKQERPNLSEESLKAIAPKIAQEQLRMIFPTILPTALVFTVDNIALASMYYSAWNPVMKSITKQMINLYIEKYPNMKYLFDMQINVGDWSPKFLNEDSRLLEKPVVSNFEIKGEGDFVSLQDPKHASPFDLLQFSPIYQNNKKGRIDNDIEISLATMGQDQRHRTIDRSNVSFTGNFYFPPILKEISLEKECISVLENWKSFYKIVPDALFASLAPYGAMVSYHKSGNFNAIAHEQGKRLCFCAQEEIYHAGLLLRRSIIEKLGKDHRIVSIFEPPCYRGVCVEGKRYCGRDIKLKECDDYFLSRRV